MIDDMICVVTNVLYNLNHHNWFNFRKMWKAHSAHNVPRAHSTWRRGILKAVQTASALELLRAVLHLRTEGARYDIYYVQ